MRNKNLFLPAKLNPLFNKITLFLLSITLYLLLDFIIYKPLYSVTLFIAFLNIIIFFINPRKGILFFIPFMLLSDISFIRERAMASIHSIYYGPFNLMTYMLLFFMFIGFLEILHKKNASA